MSEQERYNAYLKRLTDTLVEQLKNKGVLDDNLLLVEELEEKWTEMAPNYMKDAVSQYNDYPAVAIAWAAYLGMGVAAVWDTAWEEYSLKEDLYSTFSSPRGFDFMDEYIIEEMLSLNLESVEAKQIEEVLRSAAYTAISMMRHEGVEAQSVDAFHLFANTAKVFYYIGVSIELKLLGYKYERVTVS